VRYYLSRKENYDKTKKALGRFLQWRRDEQLDQVKEQVLACNPDAQTAALGTGACTKNRPCVWVYACRHDKDSQSDAEMRLFLACKIEQALQKGERLREETAERRAEEVLEETLSGNTEDAAQRAAVAAGHAAALTSDGAAGAGRSRYHNIDTFTLIFDLRDFGTCRVGCVCCAIAALSPGPPAWLLSHITSSPTPYPLSQGMACMNYDAISTLVNLCTYQYPNVVERVVLVNAPRLFSACWAVLRQVLPAAAAELAGFANSREELAEYVPEESMPADLAFS